MDHPCKVCGAPVLRVNDTKPWPHKCPACKREHARELNRRRASRKKAKRIEQWSLSRCRLCSCLLSLVAHAGRRGPLREYCSHCYKIARNGNRDRYVKACNYCGAEYPTRRRDQRYCSQKCAALASRRFVSLSCRHCGKMFDAAPSAERSRVYCSIECKTNGRRIWRTCAGCGHQFNRPVHGTMPHQDKGKYCTRSCYLDHRWGKNRPGKRSSPSEIDRACRRSLGMSLRKRCKHYGVPFDPACTREAVCERDGWICQQCGVKCHKGRCRINKRTRKMSKRNAEHDHIIPLSRRDPTKGNTFDNSQCLCRRCNMRKANRGGGQLLLAGMEF